TKIALVAALLLLAAIVAAALVVRRLGRRAPASYGAPEHSASGVVVAAQSSAGGGTEPALESIRTGCPRNPQVRENALHAAPEKSVVGGAVVSSAAQSVVRTDDHSGERQSA